MSGVSFKRKAAIGSAAGAALWLLGAARYRHNSGEPLSVDDGPAPESREFTHLMEALTGGSMRHGNRIKVLRNGHEIFPAMMEAIADARETINFSTYVYWSGEVTTKLAEAFMERARAGVEVNILLDAVGTGKMDHGLISQLQEAGANVSLFRAPGWYELNKLNNRMHRRVLVLDGRIGFVGGVGIAEEWTGDCEDQDHWRETHLRIEGPVVRDILGGFLENWAEATGGLLASRHFPELRPHRNGTSVLVVRSSPGGTGKELEGLFFTAIAGAKRRLWLTTAYFAPRKAFVDALADAARREVDVQIIVNGPHIDKEVVRKAGRRSYEELMEAGVRIFEYQQSLLHAKVLLVDDDWVTIGSANFDNRSFAINEEINVFFQHAEVAAELSEHFANDLAASKEIDLEAWRNRPLRERGAEAATELVRQLL